MAASRYIYLYERVQYLDSLDLTETDQDGNTTLIIPSNYLIYVAFRFAKNLDYNQDIGQTSLIKIDNELDPQNISDKDSISYCKDHNDYEFLTIVKLLEKFRKYDSGNEYGTSIHSKRVEFLEYLKGEFIEWYRKNKTSPPNVKLGKIKKTDSSIKKIIWTSGRKEWAKVMIDKWNEDINERIKPEEKEYASFADCVRRNYCNYKFNFKWSVKKAISYARKYK